MSRSSAAKSFEDVAVTRRELQLFKEDHPRWIDRYIDYFGAGTRPDEPCDEADTAEAPDPA